MEDYQKFKDFLYPDIQEEERSVDLFDQNQLARKLEESSTQNQDFQKFFKEIEIDMKHINNNQFFWFVERATSLKTFFKPLKELKYSLFQKFGNINFITNKFPPIYFYNYLNESYGRIGGNVTYDEVFRAASVMLEFFNSAYILKDLSFQPQITTKTFFLLDPIYRQQIRINNKKNEIIMSKYFNQEKNKFNIIKFCYRLIEQFFPNVGWRWIGGQQYAHKETLKIILYLLEYGLWPKDELNVLLINIYAVSERMFHLEDHILNDANGGRVGDAYQRNQAKLCAEIRILVAQILIHILIIYLDEDVHDSLIHTNIKIGGNGLIQSEHKNTKYNIKKLLKLYSKSFLSKKKLYTYFSYILVTYLARYNVTGGSHVIRSDELDYYLQHLFNFVADINGDIFRISLKTMQSTSFPFYLLKTNSSLYQIIDEVVYNAKQIILFIKKSSTQDLMDTSDNCILLEKFRNWFQSIIKIFDQYDSYLENYQYNIISTIKKVMSIKQIPSYIVAFLDLIPPKDNYEESAQQIRNGVFLLGSILLRKICTGNIWAQQQLFSGSSFKNFSQIYKENLTFVHWLILDIISQNQNLIVIEENSDLFHLILEEFEEVLADFDYYFDEFKNTADVNSFSADSITKLYFFNRVFSKMFENFQNKRSKYEFIIADNLKLTIPIILEVLKANLLLIEPDNEFFTFIHNQIDNFHSCMRRWYEPVDNQLILTKNQKNIMLLELFNSTLDLFARSTTRFFTDQIYIEVKESIEKNPINEYKDLINQEGGLTLYKNVVKVYTNFLIFPNNHLIDNRDINFGENKQKNGERFILKSHFKIELYEQIYDLGNHCINYIEEKAEKSREDFKFLLCAYWPMVFKLYSGVSTLFIYEECKSNVNDYRKLMQKCEDFQRLAQRSQMLQNKKVINKFENYENYPKYKKKSQVDQFLNGFAEQIKSENQVNLYDEINGQEFFMDRKKGYNLIKDIIEIYQYSPCKNFHLKNYVRYDQKNSKNIIFNNMQKTLRFNSLFREKNEKEFIKKINYNEWDFSNPQVVIKFFSKNYKMIKTYYQENPEQNQCFVIMKTSDIIKNNIEHYIHYFLNYINELDLSFDIEYYKNNILFTRSYISQILMIDNLLSNSDEYRKTFYDIIQEQSQGNFQTEPIKCFTKIWKIHKILFKFCLFKPFMDENWSEIYTIFYLINNFIQNLCENNFVDFKYWFHDNQDIREGELSMFEYYYTILEMTLFQTKVHKNKNNWISLSDRPETFYILNRICEGFTEFINGSSLDIQRLVYRKKINAFVAIVLRSIIDLDSIFYELKWHVLNYVLGLTEGQDYEVIKYVSTNFPVNKLFDHIIFLIKVLYVRQRYYKKNGYVQNLILTEKQINEEKITKPEQILDFYYKYEETFSDHIAMNIVIKIYQLMRDISRSVMRYENFMEAKNQSALNLQKNMQVLTPEEIEENCIWSFVQQIIVDIEIVYEENQINENENKNDEEPLRLFYFKKLPICFFLTAQTKLEFLSEVNIDSIEEKHEEFFDNIKIFKVIIEHLQQLYKKSKILFTLSTRGYIYGYKIFLYILSLIINILFLFFYNFETQDFNNQRGNANLPILILSIINLCLSGIIIIFWVYIKYPNQININLEKYYLIHKREEKISIYERLKLVIWNSLIKNSDFQCFFSYFLFIILGLTVSPFFYTVLLLLIIYINQLVKSVGLSFWNNIDKLFYTLLIILIVLNSFSYLLSESFRNQFEGDDIGEDNMIMCDTYFRCLLNTINLGLRAGGGISDYMSLKGDNNERRYTGRFFFDLLFFIIINLILLGIFFGIIVDAFSKLRDDMSKRSKDLKTNCFLCGLDKPTLEKKGIDFDEHIEYHSIWNYLYYILYLEWKPSNYYDGVDIFVSEKLEGKTKDEWMPYKHTLKLEEDN